MSLGVLVTSEQRKYSETTLLFIKNYMIRIIEMQHSSVDCNLVTFTEEVSFYNWLQFYSEEMGYNFITANDISSRTLILVDSYAQLYTECLNRVKDCDKVIAIVIGSYKLRKHRRLLHLCQERNVIVYFIDVTDGVCLCNVKLEEYVCTV